MADYTLYKSIITQSIQDFNKIQNELASKSVAGVTQSANGFTPTAELSELIRKHLVRPNGTLTLTDKNIGTAADGLYTIRVADAVLTSTSGTRTGYENVSLAAATYIVSGNEVKVGTAGWAKAGSAVTTIEGGAIDSEVVGDVVAAKAQAKAAVTGDIFATVKPSGTDGTDFWTITPSLASKTDGSIKYRAVGTKAGYITASTVGTTNTQAVSVTETAGTALYLAKATFSGAENTSTHRYIAKIDTAGYVPAGTTIAELAPAAVKASITSAAVNFGTGATDGYLVSAGKASSGHTAGYFSDTAGEVSGSAYVKKGAVTADVNTTTAITGTRKSTSGTTVSITASVPVKPVLTTEGYVKAADLSNATKDITISLSDANLIAGNIKNGISIFGITGTYLAPSIDTNPGASTGAELRYINLTDHTSESGVPAHTRHSYHMLAGAVSYIDNQPVYGAMADYTVATTAKNTYGAAGSGTVLPLKTATLDATYVTAVVNIASGDDKDHLQGAFVNDKTSIRIAITSIATKLTKTLTTKTGTITPDAGKLISSVDYTVQAAGTIAHTGGGLTIVNGSATAADKGLAKVVDNTADHFVRVKVDRAAVKETIASAGWVDANTTGSEALASGSTTAYIPASVNATGTASSTNAAATVNFGSATQFDPTTGAVKTAGAKSGSSAISGTLSGSISSVDQTYVIGNISISGNVSGTANASMSDDSTGTNVDKYLVALYKRQLGLAFTADEGNLTSDTGVKLSELY